jgi:hypothetical protein
MYLVMGRVGYTGTYGWTMHLRSLFLVIIRIGYTSNVDLNHGQEPLLGHGQDWLHKYCRSEPWSGASTWSWAGLLTQVM